jgi:hypothetical protein
MIFLVFSANFFKPFLRNKIDPMPFKDAIEALREFRNTYKLLKRLPPSNAVKHEDLEGGTKS